MSTLSNKAAESSTRARAGHLGHGLTPERLPRYIRSADQQDGHTASLRAAIDAHCKACIYDAHAAGTVAQQVSVCAVTTCPLWPVRMLPRQALPAWMLARDSSRVPPGFTALTQDEAITLIRTGKALS